jgi:hypothetical protein
MFSYKGRYPAACFYGYPWGQPQQSIKQLKLDLYRYFNNIIKTAAQNNRISQATIKQTPHWLGPRHPARCDCSGGLSHADADIP